MRLDRFAQVAPEEIPAQARALRQPIPGNSLELLQRLLRVVKPFLVGGLAFVGEPVVEAVVAHGGRKLGKFLEPPLPLAVEEGGKMGVLGPGRHGSRSRRDRQSGREKKKETRHGDLRGGYLSQKKAPSFEGVWRNRGTQRLAAGGEGHLHVRLAGLARAGRRRDPARVDPVARDEVVLDVLRPLLGQLLVCLLYKSDA